jgi:hypothetical protein
MKKADRKMTFKDERDERPGPGEQAGEAIGGIGGTVAGAALGSLAGPIGTIVGGIAGAVGGWWAGEKAGRAAEDMDDHDTFYRDHWDQNRREDLEYEDARIAYGVGHIAGRNPDYAGLPYEEIEPDIKRGWNWKQRDFEIMQPYVRCGYDRTMGKPPKTAESRMDRTRSKL